MSNVENKTKCETHQDIECTEQLADDLCQQKLARAERLLDQIDTAHLQVQDIQNDISLLHTAENALDLISENLGEIRQLMRQKERYNDDENMRANVNDHIGNLVMVNTLICDDTEFNGRRIFKDDVIALNGTGTAGLKLVTAALPEILGLENNDTQTTLDSLNLAARIINRQYNRIAGAMSVLLSEYEAARSQTANLLDAQKKLSLSAQKRDCDA